MFFRYTKKEIETLKKDIIVLIDTREKNNKHIIDLLIKNKIQYKFKKLDYGDYSFMIKASDLLPRDIYFDNQIVIERKNSLEELSQNLAQKRVQFENELLRKKDCKFILLIENGSYKDIFENNYNTELNKKSYLASLLTFQFRYNIQIAFINKDNTYKYICNTFYYYLKETLQRSD
jgi:ERCC4-type nuclease